MIESLLLVAARVRTFAHDRPLTNASGFFFARGERLFYVTSRHVLIDEASGHHPNRIEIELHADAANMTRSIMFSMPLYRDGRARWRQGMDAAGGIDVALIEVERQALPTDVVYRAFTPAHLDYRPDQVEIGTALTMLGFPLGFHDTLHHMPVARHAVIASSFGLRFQGQGYFLADARTHRGTSGAPLVARVANPAPALGDLPWLLLGVHSSRLDVHSRDIVLDEVLGLNCAWYADILLTLSVD